MGIFDALDISASGLIAERTRMDVTSQNLANAQSSGYRRQDDRTDERRSAGMSCPVEP